MAHSRVLVKGSAVSREGFYVAIACVAISVAALLLIGLRRTSYKMAVTGANEISVFEKLNSLEQGLYSDLSTASEDILLSFKENGEFMSVEKLEEEFIPPFVKDSAWISRGEHAWQLVLPDAGGEKEAIYVGFSEAKGESLAAKVGSFALLIAIKGEGGSSEVWYRARDEKSNFPKSSAEFLKLGWKKCVSHTGQSEKERIKG